MARAEGTRNTSPQVTTVDLVAVVDHAAFAFLAAHLFRRAAAIFLRVAALKGFRFLAGAVDTACSADDAIYLGGRPLRLPPPVASR